MDIKPGLRDYPDPGKRFTDTRASVSKRRSQKNNIRATLARLPWQFEALWIG